MSDNASNHYPRLLTGSLSLALALPVTGQIVTNNTAYQCGQSIYFARTHNASLDVTIRAVSCSSVPMSLAKWYDLDTDPDLLFCAYTHLACVDFSVWSSENPGDQAVFVRVYEDLTPDDGVIQSASLVLLDERIVVLPASTEGVASGSPGRSDGDLSVSFAGGGGGDGVLLSTSAAIVVEVGHHGESRTRFGCNTLGEAGDALDGPEQTWVISPLCDLGMGAPNDWTKWPDWTTSHRDFVQQIHFRDDVDGLPPLLPPCPEDIDRDGNVGITDFLMVLQTYGQRKGCAVATRPAGDVYPPDRGNNLVNVNDFLAILLAWGPCPG